jgi:hypothetical protein
MTILIFVLRLILIVCGIYMFLHGSDKVEKGYGLSISVVFSFLTVWDIISQLSINEV